MDGGSSNRRGGPSRPSRPKRGTRGVGAASSASPAPSRSNGRSKVNGHGRAAANSLAFTIPSNYDRGCEVQQQILDAAQQNGFAGENFFALRIALEEALVNAIKHGNRLDPDKKVRIEARVSPKRVDVMVEDEGPGFDRTAVPDPTAEENLAKTSGRGILLIESYMTKVRWDRGGRRLRMVRENK